MFRDKYEPFTEGGLAIYGLSTDSPKANTTFKEKQKLPYPLLCDPGATLIAALGFKKAPKGTTRGVFAVDKAGKVLLAEAGGPAATVDAVKQLVADGGAAAPAPAATPEKPEEPAPAEAAKEKEPAPAADAPPADKPVEEAKPTNGAADAEEKKPEEVAKEPADAAAS